MGKEEQSKAEELYNDISESLWYVSEEDKHLNAKQCAKIVVNEVLTTLRNQAILSDEDLIYWTRVQREVNKIK